MSSSPRRFISWLSRPSRLLLPALAASALLSACGGGGGGSAAPTAAPVTQAKSPGQAVYNKSCARCHGLSLQGKAGTPAIDSVRLATLGDQRLRLTIQSGKGKMPAFTGLSQAQVEALVAYLNAVT